jgi:hypothetical protein
MLFVTAEALAEKCNAQEAITYSRLHYYGNHDYDWSRWKMLRPGRTWLASLFSTFSERRVSIETSAASLIQIEGCYPV